MKPFKNPSFRTNLIILLITIVLVSTSFFFIIYYNLSSRPVKNIIEDNLSSMAKNNAQFIDYWLKENLSIVNSLAESRSITSGPSNEIESIIKSYNKIHKNFSEIAFINSQGQILYSSIQSPSVNVSDREYFSIVKNKTSFISDKLISKTTKKPIIVVCSPVIANNSFKGAIIASIDIEQVYNLVNSNNFKNITETHIFDKNGGIVTTSAYTNRRYDSNPSLIISNTQAYKTYIDKSKSNNHLIANYINYNGQKVLASYTVLNHKGWVLVSEINMPQSISAVRKSSIEAGIFTLVLITIMLIPFIFYLTRKLTTPLKDIANLASEYAMNNFDNRIIYTSNNEIGTMAKTFNTMADNLQNTYLELNKKINDLNIQKEEIKLKNLNLEQVIEVNKTILEQLEEKNKQLEQANKVKAEFLATMSHELRTPMNSIIGYTEMIIDGNDGEINQEQRKDLGIILKSAENLLALINDVLDLSKIEAGKMTYKFKKFNIVNEVESLIENIKIMSQSKGLGLNFEYSSNLPEIYSDPSKINNIILNILSNAIKFTDSGYINVSLTSEDDKYITISVTDTGVGIAEEDVKNIFDEFKQIDGSSTRKFGGTGLGLTIAKALVEGLGGDIFVTSKLGAGSTFVVKIPISKSPTVLETDNKQEPSMQNLENLEIIANPFNSKNIIIVTRNTNTFNIISDILSEYHFKAIKTDYTKAIETIKSVMPCCVFIDVDLPCTNCNDGLLSLSDLKHDKLTSHIPIVVISTQTDDCLSLSLGATDYLVKPFTKQDIVKSINRCLTKNPRGYVLLIEENKEIFNLISRVLRKTTHYSILMANSIKDIYSVLESSNPPSLIILNATLSTIKPSEVINTINSVDLQNKIPVLTIAEKNLNSLEQEYLRQNTKKILFKSDIRYSKLVNEVKKTMFEIQKL